MPSGHSNFAFCLVFWYVLETIYTSRQAAFRKTLSFRVERFLVLTFGIITPYSRVFLNYHSEKQVLVGATIGTLNALFCFFVFRKLMRNPNSFLSKWVARKEAAGRIVNQYKDDALYYGKQTAKSE